MIPPPPQTGDFLFDERFMAARHEKVHQEKNILNIFLFAKAYRTITSGWQGGTVYQEMRPGRGFKTGDFDEEKFGGLP